LQNS
jgi:hypothetical protein